MGPADVGEVTKQVKMVAGAGSDHNLRPEQVKMVAGGHNHLYLRSGGRPMNSTDVAEVSKQVMLALGAGSYLNLLFRAVA